MALSMAQKEFRRRGISASDIPAICGLNPWKSPIAVYEDKVYPPEPDPPAATVDQERGNELENALLGWMGRRTQVPIFRNTGEQAITFQSRTHELVLATPDGLGFEGELPVGFEELRERAVEAVTVAEVKSPGPGTVYDWISPLEAADGIPEYYLPQVQWQMGALEIEQALIGALVGRDLWVYQIVFYPEMFAALLARAEMFWENHVLKQIPPPVDASPDYASHLARKYPGHASDELRQTTTDVDVAVIKLREANEAIEAWEKEQRLQKNIIKNAIGDAAGIQGPWGKILWRKTKDQVSVDKKAVIAWIEENHPQEIEKFRQKKTGIRKFLQYLNKK